MFKCFLTIFSLGAPVLKIAELETCKTEKSTKMLTSWQELKNQFLSFLSIGSFQVYKKPNVDCSRRISLLFVRKKIKDRFSMSESQTALIFNLKFANINFPRVRKRSWMEKFGHFPRTEKFFSFHQKILSGQQGSWSY